MPLNNHVKNASGTFGPTASGKHYLPKLDHGQHSLNPRKTKWRFSEGYEYDVFILSDSPSHYCSKNACFFGIVDNGKIELGKTGERLAKFPQTVNVSDPWHGYPVKTSKVQDRPCDCMLDHWEAVGIIDYTTKRRIERGIL